MPLPALDDVIEYADVLFELPATYRPANETYVLGLGVGYRTFDPNESVEEYMTGISGDDVTVENPLEDKVTFPYLALTLRFPHIAGYRLNNALALAVSVDWMSSALIKDKSGNEEVSVEYNGTDLGDAKARWEYYFGTYFSGGVSTVYTPFVLRAGFLVITPQVAGTVGFSYIQNRVEVSMDMRKFALVQEVGEETLEDVFGFYAQSKTTAEMQGIAAYFAPSVGIRLVYGHFGIVFTAAHRYEKIPLHVQERTIFGDDEEMSRRREEIKMDTSGPTGTASLEYRF